MTEIFEFGLNFFLFGIIWYFLFKIELSWKHKNKNETEIYLSKDMEPDDFHMMLQEIIEKQTLENLLQHKEIYNAIAKVFNQQILMDWNRRIP